jgi:membrane protein YqaA with SNARE-associated domain
MDVVLEYTYWLVLGVLSSIGLGSGLHTFVLYLGPHIVRVANVALLHNSTSFSAQIESYFRSPQTWDVSGLSSSLSPIYTSDAWVVTRKSSDKISLIEIAMKVAFPCFFWGLGTAIGEIPPYLIARAAVESGNVTKELSAVELASSSPREKKRTIKIGALERWKVFLVNSVRKYDFIAILLAASIPNPLFDLAGITCGHFGIPFWKFFIACFLGKAVVKISLQVFSIIYFIDNGDSILLYIRKILPKVDFLVSAFGRIEDAYFALQHSMCKLDKAECASCCKVNFAKLQYEQCIGVCSSDEHMAASKLSLFNQIWGWLMVGMISMYIISIVNSVLTSKIIKDSPDLKQKRSSVVLKKATPSVVKLSRKSTRGRSASASARRTK